MANSQSIPLMQHPTVKAYQEEHLNWIVSMVSQVHLDSPWVQAVVAIPWSPYLHANSCMMMMVPNLLCKYSADPLTCLCAGLSLNMSRQMPPYIKTLVVCDIDDMCWASRGFHS